MRKQYIGDSVYYAFDGHDVVLTTENGISVSNEIILEPEVVANLLKNLGIDFNRKRLIELLENR